MDTPGVGPAAGGTPLFHGTLETEAALPLTREADKVNQLNPVPTGGVPSGDKRSPDVQTYQWNLGGTASSDQVDDATRDTVDGIGYALRGYVGNIGG